VRGKVAFTLAEMMVVLLILTICLAAFAPLMTKRRTVDISSPWRYSSNNSDIYYGMGSTQTAMIGQNTKVSGDNAKLIINTNDSNQRHVTFKQAGTKVGELLIDETNLFFGNKIANNSNGIYNIILRTGQVQLSDITNYNTYVGAFTGVKHTDGESNTAIGVNALANLTTGGNNTAIGNRACYNMSSGSNKTCLGTNSGPAANDSSTTNIVYLGSSSTTGIVSGVSSISVYSDKRLKDVKDEYKKGLEQIREVVPKLFIYKSDKEKNVRLGVIAQELQKVLPEAVVKNGDGYLIVHQEYIQYALLNAVKQLDKIMQSLITEVKTMVAKLSYHDNKIKKLEQECADLKQENNAMKQENAELKARLEKLEKFVF